MASDEAPLGEGEVLIGLSPDQYEDLAFNMADILRWMREAKWRLDYYDGGQDGDG